MTKGRSAAHESVRQAEIGRFVHRFLTNFGASVDVCDGSLSAHLPSDLAEQLGVDDRLALRFAPMDQQGGRSECTTVDGSAEFVTFGHPLLDRMLELAKGRGAAAGFLFAPTLNPETIRFALTAPVFDPAADFPDPVDGDAKGLLCVMQRVRFANAKARVRASRVVHQMQVLFRFKVSLISDEKRESIMTLIVDPVSEDVDRLVNLSHAVSFRPYVTDRQGERNAYSIRRLYRKACERLAERIESMAKEFASEADLRMTRELKRIEEYYRGLIEERIEPLRSVFRRMSSVGIRVDLSRTWQTHVRYSEQVGKLRAEADEIERLFRSELQDLNREREQRAQEVREKYQPRVEVSLSQGAHVMVPRFEWNVRLQGRVRRDITILYDVLRRKLVDHVCECCGEPFVGPVYLCGCEGLVCEHCHSRCPSCGGDLCPSCTPDRCHVCHGPLCPSCDTSCPLGAAFDRVERLRVCGACRESACSTCLPLFTYHLENAL